MPAWTSRRRSRKHEADIGIAGPLCAARNGRDGSEWLLGCWGALGRPGAGVGEWVQLAARLDARPQRSAVRETVLGGRPFQSARRGECRLGHVVAVGGAAVTLVGAMTRFHWLPCECLGTRGPSSGRHARWRAQTRPSSTAALCLPGTRPTLPDSHARRLPGNPLGTPEASPALPCPVCAHWGRSPYLNQPPTPSRRPPFDSVT